MRRLWVCQRGGVLECVINISEGRDAGRIARIAGAADTHLLDVHSDPDHHRSVITVLGPDAARAVAAAGVAEIDLTTHAGVHPRLGAVDVVPFVALGATPPAAAIDARNGFAAWMGRELAVPCFRYGPERTLPEIRRHAFVDTAPDTGPPQPHPTAGATAVGARGALVAYNVWLAPEVDLDQARAAARDVRGATIRALGLEVGSRRQVSMNLIAPSVTGPAEAFDAVASRVAVEGAELVGLIPRAVLAMIPRHRWAELDVAEDRTIESRAEAKNLRWDR